MIKALVFLISIINTPLAYGQEPNATSAFSEIQPIVREHTFAETSKYVGSLYVVTWIGYYVTQEDNLEDHGSIHNFWSNMKRPTWFDFDLFTYNWGLHTLSGSQAFLFYRAKSYSNVDAFLLTALQSLLFEFAIETYTERPSIEDMVFTPIFGSLLGTLLEKVSFKLLASESNYMRVLGYLLNPPILLGLHENIQLHPWIEKDSQGLAMRITF